MQNPLCLLIFCRAGKEHSWALSQRFAKQPAGENGGAGLRGLLGGLTAPPTGGLRRGRGSGVEGTSLTSLCAFLLQTPSRRTSKSFKPRISTAWIIEPREQSVTAFPNTKTIYFLTSFNFLYIHCGFLLPTQINQNVLYERGNKGDHF